MNIKEIIKKLTLEEKAGLCSGADFWHTKAVERLDVPSVMVSDGPHGLRKMNDDGSTIEAVCFPTASALACSFDRGLMNKVGKALGNECQAEGVAVLLGPGANIKRSPLCGRNFEYFSEDPYLSSEMATAHITGVQSKGVGTSLKHFAGNNQETRRFSVSAEIDERAFREIYLNSFEKTVKKAKPWTLMCSYNKVNGEYSSQNRRLLTDILRNEWGFEGLVMSDWGAVDDRVKGVYAGLDLEMPSSSGKNDRYIVEAVKEGRLSMEALDKAVENVLNMVERAVENRNVNAVFDRNKDHELARRVASECMVLLKNEKKILPLDSSKKIAFIGKFATEPRFQGGGSSHINSPKITSALEASAEYCKVSYAQGYEVESDTADEKLVAEAIETAKNADIAVIFAGLPDAFESEGYDRTHMKMPDCQLALIDAVCAVQPNTVVVLHNGSPVEMPWISKVKGVLEAYLGGQAVGGAVADILFGKTNPSGKLAETFPKKLCDNPSYLNFPGEGDNVRYSEGIFVGYRYYDFKEVEPLFPFGFGLSYTNFEYSALELSSSEIDDDQTVSVSVTVKNTGKADGKEVVQLYVRDADSSAVRPIKELKGFEKVELKAGESKKVVFILDKTAFAYYNTAISDWYVESGEFEIMVGASSRDIRLSDKIFVNSTTKIPVKFTLDSEGGDITAVPEGAELYAELLSKNGEKIDAEKAKTIFWDTSIHSIVSFLGSPEITRESIQEMLDKLNKIVEEKY